MVPLALAALPASLSLAQDASPPPASGPHAPSSQSPSLASAAATAGTPAMPPVAAVRQARNVAIITVHGEIDAHGVLAASVARRIQSAADAGADCIVFDIDTPGGEVMSVLKISNAIKNSPVANTIAWVNHQAYSGGALVALACREVVSNSPATLGDAMPVTFGSEGIKGLSAEALQKVLPPLVADLIDSSRRYNKTFGGYIRDEYLVQAIVANDVKLWWVRHKENGQLMAVDTSEYELLFPGQTPGGRPRLAGGSVRNAAAVSGQSSPGYPDSNKIGQVADLITQRLTQGSPRPLLSSADAGKWENLGCITDGTVAATFNPDDLAYYNLSANPVVMVNGQYEVLPIRTEAEIMQFVGASNLIRYDMVWSEHLVGFMNNIVVRGLLIVIFLVALFVEMSHPGVILPGVIALLALVCLLAPPFLVGMAAWWEVAAIFAGVFLLGLEAFVIPGFGVAGILGIVLLFLGLVATFVPGSNAFPDTPEGRSSLLYGVTTVVLSIFTAGAAMWGISRHFGSLPLLNRLVLKSTPPDEGESGMLLAMDAEVGLDIRTGDTGRTVTPMRPAGLVEIGTRVVDAVAEIGFIGAGVPIRVTSVDGMRVGVEATPDLPPVENLKSPEA